MENKSVVGLIGLPGAGKDFLADLLVKYNNFNKIAFADQIKQEYYNVSGFSEEAFKKNRNTDLEKKIRKGLWDYSDKMRKQFGEFYFITPVIQKIKDSTQSVLVTDVRTENEIEALYDINAKFVCVVREMSLNGSDVVPGTRLKFVDIFGMPVFWNYSNDEKILHSDFVVFCRKILKIGCLHG